MERLYTSETERVDAEIDRAIARINEAGGGLPPTYLTCAGDFVRGTDNANTAIARTAGVLAYTKWLAEEHIDPWTVRPSEAKRFVASLRDRSSGTRKGYASNVRNFYAAAMIDDACTSNPFRELKVKAFVEHETGALEMSELLDVLRPLAEKIRKGVATVLEHRDFAMLLFAVRLGPRSISVRNLVVADWRVRGDRAEVTFRPKGGGTQTLRAPEDLVVVMQGWLARLELAVGRELRPDDAVFASIGCSLGQLRRAYKRRALRGMTVGSLANIAKSRFKDAGIVAPRTAFHALRSSMATLASENGADRETIQRTLGHKTVYMTDQYIKRKAYRHSAADRWTLDLTGEEPAA